jgi:hypothetical protein
LNCTIFVKKAGGKKGRREKKAGGKKGRREKRK